MKKLINKSEWFRKNANNSIDGNNVNYIGVAAPRGRGSFNRNKKKYQPKTILVNKIQVRVAAVLFVPQTPQGELARLLRDKMESMAPLFGWKYKIMEKAGASIKSRVTRSNPWALEMCWDKI